MTYDLRTYKSSRKRALINYDHVISQTGTKGIFCLDKGALSIARALVRHYGLWRSSYVTAYDNVTYTCPTIAEFDAIDAIVGEFLEDTKPTMGLCEDMLTGIQDIAAAIRETSCCGTGGSGGAGATDEAPSTFTDDLTASFPDQYEDRDAYIAAKCQIAQVIINDLIADLDYLLSIDVTAIAIGVIGAALLSPIPGDELVLFIGLLIANSILGLLAAALNGLKSQITSNEDDLRCALYLSPTVNVARANFESVLSLTGTQSKMLDYMMSYTSLNRLFTWTNNPPSVGANCAACDSGIEVLYGYAVDWAANPLELTWQLHTSAYRLTFYFPSPVTIIWPAVTGQVNADFASTADFQIGTCDGFGGCGGNFNDLYNSDTQPTVGTEFNGVRWISILSEDAAPAPDEWTLPFTYE